MTTWLEEVGRQLSGVADALWGEVSERGVMPLLQPVAPWNQPEFLQPAVALGGLLSIALLSGLAVTALGTLVVTLFALWMLLVEVFGVSVELNPLGAAASR